MKNTRIFLLAALSATAFAAHADWTDDGWRPATIASTKSAAEVRTELAQAKKGPNVWAASYNPLATFKSNKSRAEVQAEYIASRDAVAAMNREDGGAAYLAEHQPAPRAPQLAGQPANAQ